DDRSAKRSSAGPFDRRKRGGIRRAEATIEDKHRRCEKNQDGEEVEHALEDDRGERAGGGHLLVAREEVWANDLACARRKHAARGKADGGRTKRIGKPRMPQRLEQVLPAQRADDETENRRHERDAEPADARVDDRG